ncbi:hypothetical protein WICPIJ_007307 [Wickerhamomyces pijperi]|uniref:Uncharacterized protein n=1 Tax=Wickerhamomyces pijperi TaxID=599730 RepID=A0A9P8Q1Y8_WICPI|nr:hypothetical protein WICPIJ_007307 [Wickerhamomyces pijperi]
MNLLDVDSFLGLLKPNDKVDNDSQKHPESDKQRTQRSIQMLPVTQLDQVQSLVEDVVTPNTTEQSQGEVGVS